ncbi:hypothetical protein SNEBB_005536 [Seison nebaliae]|nr:hypothetical protein SNEBB_005536 [Seison nebaliae]
MKFLQQIRTIHQSSVHHHRIAMIINGCGVYDGSEIHEVSSSLNHLSRHEHDIKIFAPDILQHHIINHLNGEETGGKRNCLTEAARLVRGKIEELNKLNVESFDALILPGGFGVAKNLSTYAFDGKEMKVNEKLNEIVTLFHQQHKYIAALCISPIVLAKILSNIHITLGKRPCGIHDESNWPYAAAIDVVENFGTTTEECSVTNVCIDEKNKILTSPAYMYGNAKWHEIDDGIRELIEQLSLKLKG